MTTAQSDPPPETLVVDLVNVSRRPFVGIGRFVYHLARQRWLHHSIDHGGRFCGQPLCRQAWPCPAATDAARVMEDCLTYWTRLNNQPRIGPWAIGSEATAGGPSTRPVGPVPERLDDG